MANMSMENRDLAESTIEKRKVRNLPRNVWALGLTSFFTDISSEMVLNILPLFLANVLGVRTAFIGLIEGVAESTASLLKVFSGWFSDRLRRRKWLAVLGYGLSAASKPFFYIAHSWGMVAGVRWADRIGKGIRTAPRDALVADIVPVESRGTAYGAYNAVLGVLDLPASLIAGILWQGVGAWEGFGPSAPFFFGAAMAFLAAVLMGIWRPPGVPSSEAATS